MSDDIAQLEQLAKTVVTLPDSRPTDAGQDSGYHRTDLGNAARLVNRHGLNFRHAPERGWLSWTGERWEWDLNKVRVGRAAEETIRALFLEAVTLTDQLERKAHIKHVMISESEQRIQRMISAAERGPGIPVQLKQLDADPYQLNCGNGTLDLRTGRLNPHCHEDLITKLATTHYDDDATCPLWLTVLDRIFAGRRDLITFLQRAFGYSLTGDVREQVFFIFWGGGANGKSTVLRTMLDLLGDYAMSTQPETLMVKRREGIPNDLARLRGSRLVSAIEADSGQRLAEGLVKALSGQDMISARFLYHELFDFAPTFKVFLATNHKPRIRGTDHAIWRRIRLVPFTEQIPETEQDRHLLDKLRHEFPGILRWAVEGCLAWQREGLAPPEEVRAATAAYRTEMDLVGEFLAEACVIEKDTSIAAGDLYEAYATWAKQSGEQSMTKNMLTAKLKERDFIQHRSGRSTRWLGLRLRLPCEPDGEPPTADTLVAASPAAPEQEVIHLDD